MVLVPAPLTPAAGTGHPPSQPGTSFYIRGYSHGAQTAWLERTLAAGRQDESVEWIIVQMHQCAASSSATGNGSDLGIRQEWLPLSDRYQVDLVLNGHDHDYERSFPVRGADTHPRRRRHQRPAGRVRHRPLITPSSRRSGWSGPASWACSCTRLAGYSCYVGIDIASSVG